MATTTRAGRQPQVVPMKPAEPHADAGAGEQHHLLDRERLAALVGRVVVADEAGGGRLGDGLPEAEGGAHADEHREADGRRAAAVMTDQPTTVWPMARVRFQRSAR